MHRFLTSGALAAVVTAVLWRLAAGLAREWMLLSGSGELERRLERRRVRRLALVAVEAGVAPSPDPLGGRGVHRTVRAGAVRPDDVDDMGLLEAAMRSTARARVQHDPTQLVTPRAPVQPVARPEAAPEVEPEREESRPSVLRLGIADQPVLPQRAVDPLRQIRDAATVADAERRERAPVWVIATAATGVLATLVPLVRPLGSSSPWWALAGLAIVAAAAIGAYRSR
ncbi:MAG: hypothetical protein JWM25_1348 [Thermoleophilia bacterium]|nr:hypothetical protein [Thermoleophilia bacterium]MCZ4496765.1 hypothetical protein [Thermoleophilia bacterium]